MTSIIAQISLSSYVTTSSSGFKLWLSEYNYTNYSRRYVSQDQSKNTMGAKH